MGKVDTETSTEKVLDTTLASIKWEIWKGNDRRDDPKRSPVAIRVDGKPKDPYVYSKQDARKIIKALQEAIGDEGTEVTKEGDEDFEKLVAKYR